MRNELKEEIQEVRAEIQDVRLEVEKVKASELRLIKWQLSGWVALAAIMAKGFGWLGF